MDDNPNFVPVELGLDAPGFTQINMPLGLSEGPAIQLGGGLRKRRTVVEIMFIFRAYAASKRFKG